MDKKWRIVPQVEPPGESKLCQLAAQPIQKSQSKSLSSIFNSYPSFTHAEIQYGKGADTLEGSYFVEIAFTFKELLLKPAEKPPTIAEQPIESVSNQN